MRGLTPKSLDAFDPVSQTLVTGQRDATTVPTQALFLLNSPFVRKQSILLAERVLSARDQSPERRIRGVYLLVLGRDPRPQEISKAESFLPAYAASSRKLILAQDSGPVKPVVEKTADAKVDQNDVDHAVQLAEEEAVRPKSVDEAAWMGLVQALYAAAEFRFVR